MLALSFSLPLWLVACVVIVAVAAVRLAMLRPEPTGDYGIDLVTPLKAMATAGAALFAIMLILVIQGIVGW